MRATHPLAMAVLAAAMIAGCEPGEQPTRASDDLPTKPRTGETTTPAPVDVAPAASVATDRLPAVGTAAPPDVAAPPKDATREKSGLAWKVLTKGSGSERPAPTDTVKVHYSGWTKDGQLFDSSVTRGVPTEFRVGGVIKGWQEGLQLMVVGETRRFWIPADLAYGKRPPPGMPAGQLTFDVGLVALTPGPKPPPVPDDLLAPGPDAKATKSGLRYRYLGRGTGTRHPQATDRVRVHYSGWTKDGQLFDSSVTRGSPATFPLDRVIKGWTEGVQLMVEGDKLRFWIPADLAYGAKPKRPDAPAGDLVFDVELLAIP